MYRQDGGSALDSNTILNFDLLRVFGYTKTPFFHILHTYAHVNIIWPQNIRWRYSFSAITKMEKLFLLLRHGLVLQTLRFFYPTPCDVILMCGCFQFSFGMPHLEGGDFQNENITFSRNFQNFYPCGAQRITYRDIKQHIPGVGTGTIWLFGQLDLRKKADTKMRS